MMLKKVEEKTLIENATPLLDEFNSNEGKYFIRVGYEGGGIACEFMYLDEFGEYKYCENKDPKSFSNIKHGILINEIYPFLLTHFHDNGCSELEKWNIATIKISRTAILEKDFSWDNNIYFSQLQSFTENFIGWLYEASCDYIHHKLNSWQEGEEFTLSIEVKKGKVKPLVFEGTHNGIVKRFTLPLGKISAPNEPVREHIIERFEKALKFHEIEGVESILSKKWNKITMRLFSEHQYHYDDNWQRINLEYDENLEI